MKVLTWLSVIAISITLVLCGCNDEDALEYKAQSRIVVYSTPIDSKIKAGENITADKENTLIFTGEDILWFNESTEEIKFRDSSAMKRFRENWASIHYATFCLENEVLFTVLITKAEMSYTHDDLTLIDWGGYKYYLSDGYPNSEYGNTLKKERRAAAWEKFVDQLKSEGRYKK